MVSVIIGLQLGITLLLAVIFWAVPRIRDQVWPVILTKMKSSAPPPATPDYRAAAPARTVRNFPSTVQKRTARTPEKGVLWGN
jgi:hypothetical protein